MKIRTGFVSNSSSSSFICPICKEGWDMMDEDYGETEYYKANNLCMEDKDSGDGTMHVDCVSKHLSPERQTQFDEFINRCEENRMFVKSFSPIANRKIIEDSDIMYYLFKKYGTDKDAIKKEMFDRYDWGYDMFSKEEIEKAEKGELDFKFDKTGKIYVSTTGEWEKVKMYYYEGGSDFYKCIYYFSKDRNKFIQAHIKEGEFDDKYSWRNYDEDTLPSCDNIKFTRDDLTEAEANKIMGITTDEEGEGDEEEND